MPRFIKPQLATLKMKAPAGEGWIHEIKYDGYRVQIHVDRGAAKIFTRNGHDWTKRFSAIAGAFRLKSQTIFDGEVVVVHEGRTNFSKLQADLAKGRQDRMLFYAFDILFHNGEDLRSKPQLKRKEILKELIDMLDPPVLYSDHLEGGGHQLFEGAARLNYEGIVSKRVDAPYRSDRNEGWLKIKTVQKGKFPVVGFIKDPSGVAALYLGKKEGKNLVYMGKVGTGWDRTTSAKMRRALDAVISPKSKLSKQLKKPKATWVEPVFAAEIEYRDITSEGLLRASALKGFSRS
ncbi:ATP-dependent DNA ligase [Bradyrhizobium sp. CCBAU 11361]|nr:non-homologous end-joining DNA ligase [Bradyrhizobium sp. CCBAU 11361]MDA9488680.1 ATP-dependent DNA ligase [Bradyrhizobium sp. CCBAU 11361]